MTKNSGKKVSTGKKGPPSYIPKSTSATPVADKVQDLKDYPFLARVLVTFTKNNEQGTEVKQKDEKVFKLDRASADKPWYVLRNYLVPKYMKATYGPMEVAWQRLYEIKIVKLINRADPNDITDIPIRVMTLPQLQAYVKKWELNVPVMEFYNAEKAREFVALRQADEKGYERHLEEYREGKQRTYPELDNMRGDKEAAMSDVSEFDELEKQVPLAPVDGKKPMPGAEADEISEVEEAALGEGIEDQETQVTPESEEKTTPPVQKDPFAGV